LQSAPWRFSGKVCDTVACPPSIRRIHASLARHACRRYRERLLKYFRKAPCRRRAPYRSSKRHSRGAVPAWGIIAPACRMFLKTRDLLKAVQTYNGIGHAA
jgi:hypothetical protein